MLGFQVKSCGQRDLSDDGNRPLVDSLQRGLDVNYPDWKNPLRTYMIPDTFPHKANFDKSAQAEEVVYELLRQLGTKNNEPMLVVHSYKFSEFVLGHTDKKQRSWVMGESDFVIIH